jgi:hypothetical protein
VGDRRSSTRASSVSRRYGPTLTEARSSPDHAGGSTATLVTWYVDVVELVVDELTSKGVTFEQLVYSVPVTCGGRRARILIVADRVARPAVVTVTRIVVPAFSARVANRFRETVPFAFRLV